VGTAACWHDPSRQEVIDEFRRILSQNGLQDVEPVVRDVFSGEGGANYVEKHVVFDLAPRKDADPSGAFMAGERLHSGQMLRDGEVVITFQEAKGKGLVPTSWTLERTPRPAG
jgi:hypothetical protein